MEGALHWDLGCIDGIPIRASKAAAGASRGGGGQEGENQALGCSRGGFGTKVHLVTDGNGLPLAVTIRPGQQHESRSFEETLDAVRIRLPGGDVRYRPNRVDGDKGHGYDWFRAWLRTHGTEDAIHRRSDQPAGAKPLDKLMCRRCKVVERCVGWIKACRRAATGFEKLAAT